MAELTVNPEDIGVADDSGFASIAGPVSEPTDIMTSKTVHTIADDVEFNSEPSWMLDAPPASKRKRKSKAKSDEIAKSKLLAQEQYNQEIRDQRYKRLMHLLDRSQFYSSYLIQKIEAPKQKNSKKPGPKRKQQVIDENSPPKKKMKVKKETQDYDFDELVNISEVKEKVKQKLNLSQEEISGEFNGDNSQSETDITPKYFCGKLRDYQVEGLKWLKLLYENGVNGILGDEMGLGKTIQVIALLCHLIEMKIPGPFLIVAPLSTIPNWLMEFETFAPLLPVVLLHGPKEERLKICAKIRSKSAVEGHKTNPIVLTTYEVPTQEAGFMRNRQWRYIIIDEGHRIKNPNCELVQVLKSCQSVSRLLLTGTPLQNNLKELWSLLHFLLPEVFNDLAIFEAWLDAEELQNAEGFQKVLKQEADKNVLATLRSILQPFMLRRLKEDVCLEIPAKKEVIVYAPLTQLQHSLYKAVLTRDIDALLKDEDSALIVDVDGHRPLRRCRVMRERSLPYGGAVADDDHDHDHDDREESPAPSEVLVQWQKTTEDYHKYSEYFANLKTTYRALTYKKIVNHPYLIHWPLGPSCFPQVDNELIKSSGKLLVLDAMLAKLKADGHKVLLFSTWIKILDVIEDYVSLRDYEYVRLDGTRNMQDRKVNIKSFNTDPNVFLFLISTRAGGVGLNLAAADTVIIYDSDWNPQADIQAMARCHRIGQTRPVVVYKLCTKGTIDERIMNRAEGKRKLEKMVISKDIDKYNFNSKESLLELQHLLESSENHVVTSKQDIYTDEELADLLYRGDLMPKPEVSQTSPREARVVVKKLR